MLKEIFRRATLVTEVNAKLGTIVYKDIYITDKENIHPGAFEELFMSAGEFVIQKGQKLFFFPGCTAPRFKVRQLCQKEDMAIVRTPDKATVAIIGDDTSNELVKEHASYGKTFNKDEILGIIEYDKAGTNMLGFIERLKQPHIAEEVIAADWGTMNFLIGLGCTSYSEKYWTGDITALEYFDSVMELQVPFVTQASLIRYLSQGTVMTEERYQELQNILSSNDTSNVSLAMEIMANCDYEKSALYLLLLLKNNTYAISIRKEKNHVNFQSLCKFFGVEPGHHFTLEAILQKLKAKKLLNSENKEQILKLAAQEKGLNAEEDDSQPKWFKYELTAGSEMEEAILEGDAYMRIKEESIPDLSLNEVETKPIEIYD